MEDLNTWNTLDFLLITWMVAFKSLNLIKIPFVLLVDNRDSLTRILSHLFQAIIMILKGNNNI